MTGSIVTPMKLKAHESLRIVDGAELEVKCLRGYLWITQEGDREDRVIGSGDSFVVDRRGLSLITALIGPAVLVVRPSAASVRHALPRAA